jgi:RHS repeat-associated protein
LDAAGNMTGDGTNAYGFNAESEIKSAASVNYTYDGDGNRVQKSNGKIYWYGAGTEILDESDSSGNITDEYVFFGGKRVAHRSVSSGSIYYYAEDFLGTSRAITTSTGTLCYDADFYPYGGERVVTNTCAQNYKFEGKERDTETGNDDFGARYYNSRLGRWLSADWSSVPAPVPYANLTNPQTLNLYAMVRDNPETFADLDGHDGDGSGDSGGASAVSVVPGDDPPLVTQELPPAKNGQDQQGRFGPFACTNATCTSGTQSVEVRAKLSFWDKLKSWFHGSGTSGPQSAGIGAAAALEGTCILAEPCGAAQGTIAGLALITVGSVALYHNLHVQFSQQSKIREIARQYGLSYDELSKAIHAAKGGEGRGGADDLTDEQIRELAKEVKQGLWKGTE